MKATKILYICIVTILAFVIQSCTGISYSEPQQKPMVSTINGTSQQIMITNYGYYLFNCIPLGSGGNANNSFELFSDKVSLKEVMNSFNEQCKELGVSEFSNLQTEKSSTCFFDWCPFVSTFGIYWYKEIQLSATIKNINQKSTKAE